MTDALPALLKERIDDILADGAADATAVVMGDGYAVVVQLDSGVSVAFYSGERGYDDCGNPDEALFFADRTVANIRQWIGEFAAAKRGRSKPS